MRDLNCKGDLALLFVLHLAQPPFELLSDFFLFQCGIDCGAGGADDETEKREGEKRGNN